MNYYLVKTNKELTDYNIDDYDNIIDLWVELNADEIALIGASVDVARGLQILPEHKKKLNKLYKSC